MTPQQIEDASRRKYNSVGSAFYAQAEIWDLIYQAECEIATETKMLETVESVTSGSIAGTNAYAYPTGILEVRRVEYDGQRLEKITLREDDNITLFNTDSTEQGTPLYFYDWSNIIYLRPAPDTADLTILVYGYREPALITAASQELDVPAIHHMRIVDKVTGEMMAKDGNVNNRYLSKWEDVHLPYMKAWTRKRRTGDKFNVVQDEDSVSRTVLVRP